MSSLWRQAVTPCTAHSAVPPVWRFVLRAYLTGGQLLVPADGCSQLCCVPHPLGLTCAFNEGRLELLLLDRFVPLWPLLHACHV